MAGIPISKMVVPGSNDVLVLKDSSAANKVSSPTSGNLAGLDSNGNLTDSGLAAGNTSISSIGDGTVTGAISALANTVVGSFSYDATNGHIYFTPYSGSPYTFTLQNGNLMVNT